MTRTLATARSCTQAPRVRHSTTSRAPHLRLPSPGASATGTVPAHRHRLHPPAAALKGEADQQAGPDSNVDLQSAMQAARQNAEQGLSPGAGLGTAEEQAEAAYADLINTSVDLTGSASALSEEFISDLEAGGNMATAQKKGHKLGLLGDAMQLWTALSGGAHIVKQDDGRV